jgi:hypothetical protein
VAFLTIDDGFDQLSDVLPTRHGVYDLYVDVRAEFHSLTVGEFGSMDRRHPE